jgi:hypothetical protein
MFCPECGAEYREGYTECADCGVALVDTSPAESDHPEGPFMTVFETADASLLPVVESLLDSADIPYLIQGGETSGGLFPLGSVGGGPDERLLGAVIKVPEEYVDTAVALLTEADEVPDYDGSFGEPDDDFDGEEE